MTSSRSSSVKGFDLSLVPIFIVLAVPVLLGARYLLQRSSSAAQARKQSGIGRGVEGFQTGVKRIPIPKELADRIKRGEDVSGEEITAAQERERLAASSPAKKAKKAGSSAAATPNRKPLPAGVDQGWLPETTTRTSSVKKSRAAPETPEPTRRSPRKRAQG